jgi:hypothetical protein
MSAQTHLEASERAIQIANRLLTERRLSPWESGYLRGLQPHTPTPTQLEVIERLAVKYNLDLATEREAVSER